jgi:hypothetical protein
MRTTLSASTLNLSTAASITSGLNIFYNYSIIGQRGNQLRWELELKEGCVRYERRTFYGGREEG